MAGRRRFHMKHMNHEFELDLAPLLSVMVKLVPVLVISSVFVNVNIIETDLPQLVREAITTDQKDSEANIRLDLDRTTGATLTVTKDGTSTQKVIPRDKEGAIDFGVLHKELLNIKQTHPTVFHLELFPGPEIKYDEIVRVMDNARKSQDTKITFPVQNKDKTKTVMTPYMFPDVSFGNTLEG